MCCVFVCAQNNHQVRQWSANWKVLINSCHHHHQGQYILCQMDCVVRMDAVVNKPISSINQHALPHSIRPIIDCHLIFGSFHVGLSRWFSCLFAHRYCYILRITPKQLTTGEDSVCLTNQLTNG